MQRDGVPHDQPAVPKRLLLIWGRSTPEGVRQFSAGLRDSWASPPECWRGIRENERYMWTAKAEGSEVLPAAASTAALHEPGQRIFDMLREWGDVFDTDVTVANAVLRELQPDVGETLLPKLYQQIEAVVARPGCRGSYLGSQVGAPANMLGITFWSDVESFNAYMQWAGEQPWVNVIGPVTVHVPLRLLVQRFMDRVNTE